MYLLFGYRYRDYPAGGWYDYITTCNLVEEALAFFNQYLRDFAKVQIVDWASKQVIWTSELGYI